jgi:hypothetical protein
MLPFSFVLGIGIGSWVGMVGATAAAETPTDLSAIEASTTPMPSEPDFVERLNQRNEQVLRLIENNALHTGDEFFRAAKLINTFNRYQLARVRYELLLAAAAQGHPEAPQQLAGAWDMLLASLGRPLRFDLGGQAEKQPQFFDSDPAPNSVQAVWRDVEQARAAAATAAPHADVKQIVEADQADRRGPRPQTNEDRQSMAERDHLRNQRIREIIAAGELRTAADFANAALVMQHSGKFSGYQTAHELAVSALILGDQGRGRWLVAATYDRLLGSIGHQQRFGTQYRGIGGQPALADVDIVGISDAQRVALGCPSLEAAKNRLFDDGTASRKLAEAFSGPENSLRDPQFGLRAKLPQNWSIESVNRWGDQQTTIRFSLAANSDLLPSLYYRVYRTARPRSPSQKEDYLEQMEKKAAERRERTPDYTNRPDSARFIEVAGHPACSWIADFNGPDGGRWSEYLMRVANEGADVLFFVQGPTSQIAQLQHEADKFMNSLTLPTGESRSEDQIQ